MEKKGVLTNSRFSYEYSERAFSQQNDSTEIESFCLRRGATAPQEQINQFEEELKLI